MSKFRVGVLTCIWQRHELFTAFADHWEYLNSRFKNVEFVFVAVGSEGKSSKDICDTTLFEYHHYPNRPLSNKWNYGSNILRYKNIDAAIFLGSDDFICEDTLQRLLQNVSDGYDFVGLQDCYLLNVPTKELVYFNGYDKGRSGETVGIGRCLSADLLKALSYSPWRSGLNCRLDGSMQRKLRRISYSKMSFKCRHIDGFAVDVKTGVNITPFTKELPSAPKELLTKIPVLNGYL